MIIINSNSVKRAYLKAFCSVFELDDLVDDPKNFKDSPAAICLTKYEQSEELKIIHDELHSGYDYETYVRGGNSLMSLELEHYNKLIFKSGHFQSIMEHLASNPYSKKGVLELWSKGKDFSGDIPCVVYMWFRKRGEKLDMSCHMRANDAYRLLLIDMHIMTTVHNYMASELALEKGSYYHFVDSLHLYKRDREGIQKLYDQYKNER